MEVLTFEIKKMMSLFLASVTGDYLEEPMTGELGKNKDLWIFFPILGLWGIFFLPGFLEQSQQVGLWWGESSAHSYTPLGSHMLA